MCNAADDDVIDAYHMVDFARALRDKKIPHELHVFPYGGHGFGGCKPNDTIYYPGFVPPDLTAVSQWKDLFVTWLNKVLLFARYFSLQQGDSEAVVLGRWHRNSKR